MFPAIIVAPVDYDFPRNPTLIVVGLCGSGSAHTQFSKTDDGLGTVGSVA
jgi:hypothetical protein